MTRQRRLTHFAGRRKISVESGCFFEVPQESPDEIGEINSPGPETARAVSDILAELIGEIAKPNVK